MAGADPNRFEPLLGIRKVLQHAEVERVAESATRSQQRERDEERAIIDEAAARRKLEGAELAQAALATAGTTAARMCLAEAYARRCRARLRDATTALASARGASEASERELRSATERLAQARGERQVVESYMERARQQRRQLVERRRD
ncbi:MAG: hypothetical protein R3B48_28570 [Kofleriaceae bacterium]